MASIRNSYWYDSGNNEYIIPIVDLGNLTSAPDSADMMGLSSSYSSSYSFKGSQSGEFPAVVQHNQTIHGALGRVGTFYPSSDTISGPAFFRLSVLVEDHPWFDYFAGGTESADSNDRSGWGDLDDYVIDVCLGLAKIGDYTYLGIYTYGTLLGPDDYSAWCFCYMEDPEGAWNEIAEILDIGAAPGTKGYNPTGTKYVPGKKGIGGVGHGATHKKQTPAYETDILHNPGAPDESAASAIGSGMLKAYDVTDSALEGVAACLFGSTLATQITGLFYNPMDFIISLNVFPVQPNFGASTPIKLGRWQCTAADLGANASGLPLTSQFKTFNFGTLNVFENWGSFLDYSHTQIELYLPFIGAVELDTTEVMDGTITLDYTIDFFTGLCVANVNCNKMVETPDGKVYPQSSQHSYQGNCAISVPLGQVQYGNMIGALIQTAATGLTKGPAAGVASATESVFSGAFKPSVTTRGTISANAGYCAILKPYIRITRPVSAEPESFQEVMGYTSYIDSTLGDCEDFCVCENIDLHTVTGATASEIERIRQMCLEGVHV